jgi:hypothetical protein
MTTTRKKSHSNLKKSKKQKRISDSESDLDENIKRSKSKAKRKRNTRTRKTINNEAFFTTEKLAAKLVHQLHKRINLSKFKVILEPSSGDSAFIHALKSELHIEDKKEKRGKSTNEKKKKRRNTFPKIIAFDIDPPIEKEKSTRIKKADFLKVANPVKRQHPDDVLCIGNVPFGSRGKTAGAFIEHCSNFSDHIAFILPLSCIKEKFLQRHVPRNFHIMWKKVLRGEQFHDHDSDDSRDSDDSGESSEQSDESSNSQEDNDNISENHNKMKTTNVVFLYLQRLDYPRSIVGNKTAKPNEFWKLLVAPKRCDRKECDLRVRGSGSNAGVCFEKYDKDFFIDKQRSDDWFIEIEHGYKRYRKDICKEINRYQCDGKYNFLNTVPNVRYLDKNQLIKVVNKITEKTIDGA